MRLYLFTVLFLAQSTLILHPSWAEGDPIKGTGRDSNLKVCMVEAFNSSLDAARKTCKDTCDNGYCDITITPPDERLIKCKQNTNRTYSCTAIAYLTVCKCCPSLVVAIPSDSGDPLVSDYRQTDEQTNKMLLSLDAY